MYIYVYNIGKLMDPINSTGTACNRPEIPESFNLFPFIYILAGHENDP